MTWTDAAEVIDNITERRLREQERDRRRRIRTILSMLPPSPIEEAAFDADNPDHAIHEVRKGMNGSLIGVCICGWTSAPFFDITAARRAVHGHVHAKLRQR